MYNFQKHREKFERLEPLVENVRFDGIRPATGTSARASIRRSTLAEWTIEAIDEITARAIESA